MLERAHLFLCMRVYIENGKREGGVRLPKSTGAADPEETVAGEVFEEVGLKAGIRQLTGVYYNRTLTCIILCARRRPLLPGSLLGQARRKFWNAASARETGFRDRSAISPAGRLTMHCRRTRLSLPAGPRQCLEG